MVVLCKKVRKNNNNIEKNLNYIYGVGEQKLKQPIPSAIEKQKFTKDIYSITNNIREPYKFQNAVFEKISQRMYKIENQNQKYYIQMKLSNI